MVYGFSQDLYIYIDCFKVYNKCVVFLLLGRILTDAVLYYILDSGPCVI